MRIRIALLLLFRIYITKLSYQIIQIMTKKMIIILFLPCVLTVAYKQSYAQQPSVNFSANSEGLTVNGDLYKDMNGSPYLFDEWVKGNIQLKDGTIYNNLNLKYDQVRELLIFLADDNTSKRFSAPIKAFTLTNADDKNWPRITFRNGFKAIDGGNEKTYYEVLADGNTQLLKRTAKMIVDERAPGSLILSKQISATTKFYISDSNRIIKIKKDKESILEALNNKQSELETYIKNNNLNLKGDADLVKLIEYYNTLK